MIGKTVSHFRIESELGKGGMGVVYKARDTKLDIDRALKFLSPNLLGQKALVDRFLTEARTLAAVQHPNICPIQEIGEEDGQVFIAMSYLEGKTLQEVLRGGPLSPYAAVKIIKEVVSGLQKAHGQGVIHRDIKPGNVMLTEEGRAVIMDFGLAKQSGATALTRTGTVMGTVAYMSPEQARGTGVDERSDLWSVGVMLYEMLTGRLPFEGETEVEMLSGVLGKDPAPVSRYRPEVPGELEEVVERLLEKEPGRRYTDAGKVLAALEAVPVLPEDDAATVPLVVGGRRFRLQRWQRRRLVRWTALGGSAAALAALVLFVWPGLLVPTAAISAIAVMPLTERAADSTEAYFAEGVTDELITSLSKMRSLTVISRSSAEAAQARYGSPEEIARHLGVQALMEGTVQREGERLRMTVQLVRAGTGEVLWADSYERPQRSVYALQGEIARAVGAAISVEMTPEETAALAATRDVDPKAFGLLQRARYHSAEYSAEGFRKSMRFLRSALGIDPSYAEAYAELAGVYLHLGMGFGDGMDSKQAYQLAGACLDSALALNPDLATAYSYVAYRATYYHWNWSESETAFLHAIELDPGNSAAWDELGYLQGLLMGQREEGIASVRRAKELDPLVPVRAVDLAAVLGAAGRYEEAIVELDAALQLNPTLYPARIVQVNLLRRQGKYQESIEAFQQMEKEGLLLGGDRAVLGMSYALAGNRDEAEQILQELLKQPEEGELASTSLAMLYNALGRKQEAVELLVKAYEAHENWFPMYLVSPDLANLYDDPRIRSILDALNLSWIVNRG